MSSVCALFLTFALIHTTLCILSAIFVIYILWKFIVTTKKDSNSDVKSYIFGTLFIVDIIFAFLTYGLWTSAPCYFSFDYYGGIQFQIIKQIFGIFYTIQSFLLQIIFFYKITKILESSPKFKLSKLTKICFKIMFIVFILYAAILFICDIIGIIPIYVSYHLFATIMVNSIILMLSLVVLFVYKLIKISHSLQINNNSLSAPITKIIILQATSLFITILYAIYGIQLYDIIDSRQKHYIFIAWIFYFIGLIDLYTNLFCVIFCYESFQIYYVYLCGHIDSKCRVCFRKMVTKRIKSDQNGNINDQSKTEQNMIDLNVNVTKSKCVNIHANNDKNNETVHTETVHTLTETVHTDTTNTETANTNVSVPKLNRSITKLDIDASNRTNTFE